MREVIFIDEDRLQGSRFETVKKTGYVIFYIVMGLGLSVEIIAISAIDMMGKFLI